MRIILLIATALVLAAAPIATAAAAGCRCATTFQGSGPSRQVQCEGFNPDTHERCRCEQIHVNQQVGCRPADSGDSPARGATPRPRRLGG
jgi:hypothetical protein